MPCCGQKRATYRRAASAAAPPVVARTPPTSAVGWVRVSYAGHEPVNVVGAGTGQAYVFSSERPILHVDARDAPALVQSDLFLRLP